MNSLILYLPTFPLAYVAGQLVMMGEPWAAVGAILAYLIGVAQGWLVEGWTQ